MINNYLIFVTWEDDITEKIFSPIIPSPNDYIRTPHRYGIITNRRIDAVEGGIFIYANSKNFDQNERNYYPNPNAK